MSYPQDIEPRDRENIVMNFLTENQGCSKEAAAKFFKNENKYGVTMTRVTVRRYIDKLVDAGIVSEKPSGLGKKTSLFVDRENPFVIASKVITEFENLFFPLFRDALREEKKQGVSGREGISGSMILIFNAVTSKFFYLAKTHWTSKLNDIESRARLMTMVFVAVAKLESRLMEIVGPTLKRQLDWEERDKLHGMHNDLLEGNSYGTYGYGLKSDSLYERYQTLFQMAKLPDGWVM